MVKLYDFIPGRPVPLPDNDFDRSFHERLYRDTGLRLKSDWYEALREGKRAFPMLNGVTAGRVYARGFHSVRDVERAGPEGLAAAGIPHVRVRNARHLYNRITAPKNGTPSTPSGTHLAPPAPPAVP